MPGGAQKTLTIVPQGITVAQPGSAQQATVATTNTAGVVTTSGD